ncbi:hypothetical protein [Aureimonas frigidaquae]|uniref:hypothetical protein n=1 Tax=Aureimonas frigidaquae TaxID=424757 RepID=UPI0012ED3DA9|nr:hypothetical protein [Aureimonas frigidaquae]
MPANHGSSKYDGAPTESDARIFDEALNDGPVHRATSPSKESEQSENRDVRDEFAGLPNDFVDAGKFVGEVAPLSKPISAKSVSETFGIDESELYKSDENEDLTRAVADLD